MVKNPNGPSIEKLGLDPSEETGPPLPPRLVFDDSIAKKNSKEVSGTKYGANNAPVPESISKPKAKVANHVQGSNSHGSTAEGNVQEETSHNPYLAIPQTITTNSLPQYDEISTISRCTRNICGISRQPYKDMVSLDSNSDIEQGHLNACDDDILADAVLVKDQVVYDAEPIDDQVASTNG